MSLPLYLEYKLNIPDDLLAGTYGSEMKVAVPLAIQAGFNMKPHLDSKGTFCSKNMDVRTKANPADLCSIVDTQNEELITQAIHNEFPDHVIIGEENTGVNTPVPLTKQPTWIIDPIDGTTNFVSGGPMSCVSIGFCYDGHPVMGVVYSPATDELYLAMTGVAAYRNGVQISSKQNNVTLTTAVIAFGFGTSRSNSDIDLMLNGVKRLLKSGCRAMRCYGSGVLELCYVASGRIDVVYTGMGGEGWKPWDYCAAMVVVEEAGATIQSLKGNSYEFNINGSIMRSKKFDIYSKSMICGVNRIVVEECRCIVLDQ